MFGVEASRSSAGLGSSGTPFCAWAREFIAAMTPFSDGGHYLNFPGMLEEGEAMIQRSFGQKYERMAALKKYDRTNLFQLNQNIKPAV